MWVLKFVFVNSRLKKLSYDICPVCFPLFRFLKGTDALDILSLCSQFFKFIYLTILIYVVKYA
jgi:hypothetical protein